MTVNEIILMCYIVCIALCVSALTIAILAERRRSSMASRAMAGFIVGMLIICFYDMAIYYCDYVIGNFSNLKVMRIGNCIIALNMFLWVLLQSRLIDREGMKLIDGFVKKYLLFYAAMWFLLTFFLKIEHFYALKWMLLSTDIILMISFLASSVGHIIYASSANERIKLYYMLIITAMLIWNYISYFWGETSVYWGNSHFIRDPLDLTIVFWLIINAATLAYVHRMNFLDAFSGSDKAGELNPRKALDEKFERVQEKCGLTPREKELVELIYCGKSNKEIAELLFLSESTVKTHIYNIFRKMGVKNRVEVTCMVNGNDVGNAAESEKEKE